jgi:hypothetical protein
VPPGAAEALAQKVVEVLHDPKPVPFPPRFTAQAVVGQVLEVYGALL